MAKQTRRLTPMRLSFNLDDFRETEREIIDLNTTMAFENLNNELEHILQLLQQAELEDGRNRTY
ncbi:PEP-CTERM sorting domain-containing protein [Sesbania bispinosa]|nr:PEP-CTERM sorting domain-containing protein [Sesbania bispinosa]